MRLQFNQATLADLEKGEYLEARCGCGNRRIWAPPQVPAPLRTKLTDVQRRLFCSRCWKRGTGVLEVKGRD